jgi:vitamin B12 transporter
MITARANGTRILEAGERSVATDRSQRIKNVAKLTLLGAIEYDRGGNFDLNLSGRYVGERVDSDFVDFLNPGEIVYPAYLVFDLTGGVRLRDGVRVGFELRNLGDEDYFEVRGYNLPGRSVSVTASYAW